MHKRAKDPSQAAILLAETERERRHHRVLESDDAISGFSEKIDKTRNAKTQFGTSPTGDLASLTRRLSYTGSLPENLTQASEVCPFSSTKLLRRSLLLISYRFRNNTLYRKKEGSKE